MEVRNTRGKGLMEIALQRATVLIDSDGDSDSGMVFYEIAVLHKD